MLDAIFKFIGSIFKKIFEFIRFIISSITGRIDISNKMAKEYRVGEQRVKKFESDKRRRLKSCDEI